MKILVYGYGNPGRQDDALGVMLAEEIDKWAVEGNIGHVVTDTNYQLNIEDAAVISDFEIVIFADASLVPDKDGYLVTKLAPCAKYEFSTHSVGPSFILHLCHEIYGHFPLTYLVHIAGYEWELGKQPTPAALNNLQRVVQIVKSIILDHLNNKQNEPRGHLHGVKS